MIKAINILIHIQQRGKSIRASVLTIVILHQTTPLNYGGWYKNWCKTYLYRLDIEVILPYKLDKN